MFRVQRIIASLFQENVLNPFSSYAVPAQATMPLCLNLQQLLASCPDCNFHRSYVDVFSVVVTLGISKVF